MKITIQELLYHRGLDEKANVKLVRHKDSRFDIYSLYRSNYEKFLKYQQCQGKDVFKKVDYIVSFIGEENTFARFIGVYKIISGNKLIKKKTNVDGMSYLFEYDIKEVNGFEELKDKVIIDWGTSSRSWHQWIKHKKEVVNLLPGLHYRQFDDYFNFILDFQELTEIVNNAYPDWKRMLSATKGIYLINDSKSGQLYIGSAYGEEGIWGRWSSYVKTNGHGGNRALKKLISNDKNYSLNFRFSILMLLPKTVTQEQAINMENLYKKKLGTNSFGLNCN